MKGRGVFLLFACFCAMAMWILLGFWPGATATGQETSGAPPAGASAGTGAVHLVPAQNPFGGGLLEWFSRGGIFMWPLLLASLVGLAAIIERGIALRKAGINTRRFIGRITQDLRTRGVSAAIETCRATPGPVAATICSGLLKAKDGPQAVEKAIEAAGGMEVSFLQRGLIILASVANIAPLLGFLGTVSGMINAFESIAAADQVSARLVGAGIAEALITTEAGLVIAIPVQMFHNYYVSRIDRFVTEIEEGSMELINELSSGKVQEA